MSLKQQVFHELTSTPTASIVVLLLFWGAWRRLQKRRGVSDDVEKSTACDSTAVASPGFLVRLTHFNKTNPVLFIIVLIALLYCAVSISGNFKLPAILVAAIYTLPFIYLLIQAEKPDDSHGLFLFKPVLVLIGRIRQLIGRFIRHPKTKLATGFIYVAVIFLLLIYYLMVSYNVIGYGFGAGPTLFFVHLALLLALDAVLQFVSRQKSKGYYPANMIYLAVPLFMGLVLLDPARKWYPSTFSVARSLLVLQLSLFFIYIVVVYLLIKHGQKIFPRFKRWFRLLLALVVAELALVPVAMTTTTVMRLDLSSCAELKHNSKMRLLPIPLASDVALGDQYLYVSQKEKKLITRFSVDGEAIEHLKLDSEPQQLALDRQSHLLFVLHVDDSRNNLTAIDTTSFSEPREIELPGCHEAFAQIMSTRYRRLLILCASDKDNLFVVDTTDATVVASFKNPVAEKHAYYAALDEQAENIWTINLFGGNVARLRWNHTPPEQIELAATFPFDGRSVIQGIEVLPDLNQVVISKNFQLQNFPFGGLEAYGIDNFEPAWNLSIYSARYLDYDTSLGLLYVDSMADGLLHVIDPTNRGRRERISVGEQVRGVRVLEDHSVLICSKCGVAMYTPPRCYGKTEHCTDIVPRLTHRFSIGYTEAPEP